MKQLNNHDKFFILFVVLFAIFRLYVQQYHTSAIGDSAFYLYKAREIIRGDFSPDRFHSLIWHYVIAFFYLIFNDYLTAGKIASVIFTSISLVLIYIIGKRIYNSKSALISVVLFAFQPVQMELSITAFSEPIFVLFLLLTLYWLIDVITDSNPARYIKLGIALGLMICARFAGIPIVFTIIVFIITYLFICKTNIKTILKNALLILIPIVVLLLPFIILNKIYYNTFKILSANISTYTVDPYSVGDKSNIWISNFFRGYWLYLFMLVRLISPIGFTLVFIETIKIFSKVVDSVKENEISQQVVVRLILLIISIVYFSFIVYFDSHLGLIWFMDRYLYPIFPILFLFIGNELVNIGDFFNKYNKEINFGLLNSLLLILSIFYFIAVLHTRFYILQIFLETILFPLLLVIIFIWLLLKFKNLKWDIKLSITKIGSVIDLLTVLNPPFDSPLIKGGYRGDSSESTIPQHHPKINNSNKIAFLKSSIVLVLLLFVVQWFVFLDAKRYDGVYAGRYIKKSFAKFYRALTFHYEWYAGWNWGKPIDTRERIYADAFLWIAKNTHKSSIIAVPWGFGAVASYYTDRNVIWLEAYKDIDSAINYFIKKNVSYIVIESRYYNYLREFTKIVEDNPNIFELVYSKQDYDWIKVYRFYDRHYERN